MTTPSLDIVLESPLDDLPPRRGLHPLAAFVLAAAIGAAATVGAASALGDDAAVVTTTTSTIPAATDAPAAPATDLVLEDGTRIEQLRWWSEDGRLSVLVAATVRPGADPAEATPVVSGFWELVLTDGRIVEGRASSDVGVSTIEFAGPGVDAAAAATLRFSPPVETVEREVTWTEDAVSYPWVPSVTEPLVAIDDARVALDAVRIDDQGGEVVWHLESEGRHRATVDVEVAYQEEGGDERIVSRYGLPSTFLQFEASELRPLSGETLELYHLDDPIEPTFRSRFWGDPDPVDVEDVTVTWTVTITAYSNQPVEASVSISP